MKHKPKRHVTKSKGKKVSKSQRGKAGKNLRSRSAKGTKAKRGETVKRTKLHKAVVSKSKIQVSKKQSKVSKRSVTKPTSKPRPETLTIAKRKRGKEIITLGFGKTRKVETKIQAVETSEKLKQAIDNQLKRKQGKPPKGVVIVVRDKKGNEAAHVTRPSFVANKKNLEKELARFTKELKKDFSKTRQQLATKQGRKKPKRRKGERGKEFEARQRAYETGIFGGGSGGGDEEGYGNYNPDNIQEIEIKFLY